MYKSVEDIDYMVGCLAEQPRPKNYIISDTAFYVFIMNASRRLFCDRFFQARGSPCLCPFVPLGSASTEKHDCMHMHNTSTLLKGHLQKGVWAPSAAPHACRTPTTQSTTPSLASSMWRAPT